MFRTAGISVAVAVLIGFASAQGVLWQIGIGIATLMIGTTLLWWWVPKWQMQSVTTDDPKARADIEDNFRKTVGQALGGAFVLLGAGVAYLQFAQQQQASHDLLISNQVAKGFEQLASHEMVMRLGGIYALEGVMNTSDQYHQPVLEALCAFVRDGTMGMIINDTPTTDIQAVLTVVGRRKEGSGEVNLTNAKIPKANLPAANLSGAMLFRINMSGASLPSANLSHAFLEGAHLEGANLSHANLVRTDMIGASLKGATWSEPTWSAPCCGTPT